MFPPHQPHKAEWLGAALQTKEILTAKIHNLTLACKKTAISLEQPSDINEDVLISRLYSAIQKDGETYRMNSTIRDNMNKTEAPHVHSYQATKIEPLDTSAETPQMEQIHPVKVSNNSITSWWYFE